ncbi:MAG: glycosyltransferase family 4 protein [Proteobacteria bacterium]|nr:glycosyltransferase family 4 protein [Pseudomonadota bacterium]
MKIVHVTNYYMPQLSYHEPYLARECAKLGHNVNVITSNKAYPLGIYKYLEQLLGKRNLKAGVYTDEDVIVIRLKTLFDVSLRAWLQGLEKTLIGLNPDVIYVHGITGINSIRVALLKASGRIKGKLIYDDHMLYSVMRKGLFGKLFYSIYRSLCTKLLLSQANAFIAVTEETKLFMSKECGIPQDKIVVNYLGVDTETFKFSRDARKELRIAYNLSDKDIAFIYAGKIIKDKGPHLLLDAGIQLMKNYSNIYLFMIGDGDQAYMSQMKEKVKISDVENRIIWHKAVKNRDLYKYYSTADIGVWPLQESLTMLEACSCELPIIVKDSFCLRQRIINDNGLMYKEGNIDDLAKCMEKLILDENLRQRMGKRGRELMEREYSWTKIVKHLLGLCGLDKT